MKNLYVWIRVAVLLGSLVSGLQKLAAQYPTQFRLQFITHNYLITSSISTHTNGLSFMHISGIQCSNNQGLDVHKTLAGQANSGMWSADNFMAESSTKKQISRDVEEFETLSVFPITPNSNSYTYLYDLRTSGRDLYREKQVYDKGGSYLSSIKYSLDAGSRGPVKISEYPNPSNGIVGIKFDNNSAGKYVVLKGNARGQTVVIKNISIYRNSYQQSATLQAGIYLSEIWT